MFDVLEVRFDTKKVRVLATGKSARDAEAIRDMAVIRRGVNESFYVEAPAGLYGDGTTWQGVPK